MSVACLEIDVRLPLDRFEVEVSFAATAPVTAIFGPSGSGKTSLLETVAGLRRGALGRVTLGDEVWLDSAAGRELPPEARRIGYVPQDGLLFPHWNVRRNLLAGAGRARRAGQEPEAELERVAELLELEPLLDRDVATLSGGERQRVALGRALGSGPRLLLLDEPLAALDLPLRRRLLPFLRRLREELTIPMLLVTHDPIEVQALADEVLVLRDGVELARGEPRHVLTDPAVFPLAAVESFENVLAGRLRHRDDTSHVILESDTGEVGLVVSSAADGPGDGDDVLVGLFASDILLATERPRGISARNVLRATVREVRPLERYDLIRVELLPDVPPLAVEVTRATSQELALGPGRPVFLIVKAASCRVYGSAASRRALG